MALNDSPISGTSILGMKAVRSAASAPCDRMSSVKSGVGLSRAHEHA
jgi:hypothetical protein